MAGCSCGDSVDPVPRSDSSAGHSGSPRFQLLTIPVHADCNKAYQYDEDYFVHTLMPFAPKSYAGRAIYNDVLQKFRGGRKVGLTRGVLEEFEPMPSGLILPANKVVKRFQGERVSRIAWKIVRGLYFHHHGILCPRSV